MSAGAAGRARPVVALDAMGGDHAPAATVQGALDATAAGERVLLVGDRAAIEAEVAAAGADPAALHVVHAPDRIEMGDHAAREIRRRRESSIYVATEQLRQGEAQALVTLGNTGAALSAALVVLGRLRGVERPALGAVLPSPPGPTLLLDAGANAENRASHLVQFAHLGAAYMQAVLGVARPRVALLSVGEEATKGSALTLAVHEALAGSTLHFIGNVEGGDIVSHRADVVVTDGFTGNVALKLMEGMATMLLGEIRARAERSWRGRAGGLLLRPALGGMRETLDYRRYGGVPLLGVDGAVFVGHGRSDRWAVANAIRTAADAVELGLLDTLAASARDAAAVHVPGQPPAPPGEPPAPGEAPGEAQTPGEAPGP